MDYNSRYDDMPKQIKWIMTFINRIGFPIMVCIWLAYQQYTQVKEMIRSLDSFKEVMSSLKLSIDQQTRILRHKSTDD